MEFLLLVFILLIVYFFVEYLKKIKGFGKQKLPYKKKDYFFTIAEKNFFKILNEITNKNNLILFSKVRVADLLYISKKSNNWITHLNKIKSKHIDFLICDNRNIKPLLAIELDDSSHNRYKRQQRDNFINQAFNDSELPILRVKVSYNYDKIKLEDQIKKLIYI